MLFDLEVHRKQPWTPRLILSDWTAFALVCGVAAALRALPQLVAYPHPIGYDVVNYYIPVTANLDRHWSEIAQQFPFYALVLHYTAAVTGWSAQFVVPLVANIVYAGFAAAVYLAARKSLALKPKHAVFLTLFVVFQVAALRTTWDLHRDMLAITGMVGALAFLGSRKQYWPGLAFCLLAAVSDRMVGTLLVATLVAYGLLQRQKPPLIQAAVSAAVLVAISGSWVVAPLSLIASGAPGMHQASQAPNYQPSNMTALFLVMDGLLIAPAALGIMKLKRSPVTIAALIALAGSLTWLVFPDHTELGADRWIVLLGIWLSFLAGYGILSLAHASKLKFYKVIMPVALIAFCAIGIEYAVSPYEHPFVLFAFAKNYFSSFSPPTMQFSALDVKDTDRLIDSIKSVNLQTEENAVIVGSKDWKGFMELYLTGDRQYRYSDDPKGLFCSLGDMHQPAYFFEFSNTGSHALPASAACP